VEKQGEQ